MLGTYDGNEPYFFVCYSHADDDTVLSEMRWLRESGIHLWYDEGIEVGTTWRRALADALDKATGLIFMCSAQSLASDHCRKELSYALDHDKPIFVVRLEDVALTADLALYLNDTQILDRKRYSSATYRQKLLSALSHHSAISPGSPPAEAPADAGQSRRLLPVAVVLSIAALTALGFWYVPDAVDEAVPVASAHDFDFPKVAIMPMEVLTEDDALHYIARASEEDLRGRMQASIYEPVNVPDSALELAATEIGRAYDVDYVWYRSAARQGDLVRIAKRLASAHSGQDVRVFQHDLNGSDPFELQDQLARYTEEIMWAVDQGEGERVDALPLEEMNAYELMYTSKGNRAENHRRALELAPDLYNANSAVALDLFWDWVMQRSDSPGEALRLARRGRELAPFDQYAVQIAASVELGLGQPDLALGYVTPFFSLKSVTSQAFYDVLIATGQIEAALAHAERNPIIPSNTLGLVYLAAGQYEESVEQYLQWTQRAPKQPLAWLSLMNALGYLDRKEEADRIVAGLRDAGWRDGFVADYEVGIRRYWGKSGFGEALVGGLKRLGYE